MSVRDLRPKGLIPLAVGHTPKSEQIPGTTNHPKPPGETMKIDPQTIEQLNAINKKYIDAANNHDAVARAALYTEDAVLVNDTGPIYGREAIVKHWADVFQKVHFTNHLDKADQNSPHVIGTTGNEIWGNGDWSCTVQGQDFGPKEIKGYWGSIAVLEDGVWKDRMAVSNVTPAPAATPPPTPNPGPAGR
jgi:ketosteroid isomerase-like protein